MSNATWRLIGRVLITLILFTTAYEKLKYSEIYKLDFARSIEHFESLTAKIGLSLPSVQFTSYSLRRTQHGSSGHQEYSMCSWGY